MGRIKEYELYTSEKFEWIRQQLDDQYADENTNGWDELEEAYDNANYFDNRCFLDGFSVDGLTPIMLYEHNVEFALDILNTEMRNDLQQRSKLVMLYSHIVGAIEAYLSSTFINIVPSSDTLIRKLIESDPFFAKKKFTLKEIYTRKENIKLEIMAYLNDLIFHDIRKVKPMYLNVLGVEFGNVEWLFKAVKLRHDCVHRAGFDKKGNEAEISVFSVERLLKDGGELVKAIDKELYQN